MGRASSITQLPKDIRLELDKRLVERCFSEYDSHVLWLKSKGYNVSKSAVHRYAEKKESQQADDAVNLSPAIEVRLRCLEVAVVGTSDLSFAELTERAEKLMLWVYS